MSVVSSLSSRSRRCDTEYKPVGIASEKTDAQTSSRQIQSVSASKPRSKRTLRTFFHISSHVVSFLWLVPVVALIVLNFKNHVIGASIWCPGGKCNAEAYGDNAIARASKLDAEDHNILGALQFVSKALEVWFMFVATALVYDLAIYLAKSSGGLPIGYLFTHLEFSDIRNLINPLLWTSPVPHGNLMPSKTSGTWRLYMFAILAAALTILTNLMGPATAVLVLPTLRWVDTGHQASQLFGLLAASDPPRGDTVFPGCSNTQLVARNYTCTSEVYGPSLDDWLSQLLASKAQAQQDYGGLSLGTSQEGLVEFSYNISTIGDLYWIPNRQVLRALSYDLQALAQYVTGSMDPSTQPQKQPAYNNSLETVLQREGPSLGVEANCFAGDLIVKDLAKDKQIRCLGGWQPLENNTTYTKCFRVGTGWGPSNQVAGIYLGDKSKKSQESQVRYYTSDRATAFNPATDAGSQIQTCLQDDTASCDWDNIIETPLGPELANTTINPFVSEYAVPSHGLARGWCEATVYTAFPTYTINTALSANPLWLVNLNHLPSATDKNFNKTPIAISPDWMLAAWSVADNGTVNRSREVGKELARVLPQAFEPFDDVATNPDQLELLFIHLYSLSQALSFINYDYTEDATAMSAANKSKHKTQRVLKTWATLRVWAYGLSGRTAKLGVAVAILGCACVVLRLLLAASLRIKHEHTVLELFVAALEHHPTREFDGLDDRTKMAKVSSGDMEDNDHDALVERVTKGFGALLEQVQDLAAKNDALEQRLTQVSAECTVPGTPLAARRQRPELEDPEYGESPKTRKASELGQKPGVRESGDMDTETQGKARWIAEGVQAWKKLTEQRVPDPTGTADATAAAHPLPGPSSVASNQSSAAEALAPRPAKKSDTSNSTRARGDARSSVADRSGSEPPKHSDTSYSTRPKADAEAGRKCPFASTFGSMPIGHPEVRKRDSGTQRPDSLPTPPELTLDPIQSHAASKRRSADLSSVPPSAAGSASKCPIRFLDHYSPEEVAAYFENHKHEIPRSHEVCVKRYQSNVESIRQLDAKYGSLVNMIQGLGVKHQPLLPTKEEEEGWEDLHGRSLEKIRDWADGVNDTAGASKAGPDTGSEREEGGVEGDNPREGRFQRPLHEIRVGESPSRPWGVSVPLPHDRDEYLYTQPAAEGRASQTSLLQERPTSSGAAAAETAGAIPQPRHVEQPKMVFTGPVFIGYSPDQAAALLRQTGMAAANPKQ